MTSDETVLLKSKNITPNIIVAYKYLRIKYVWRVQECTTVLLMRNIISVGYTHTIRVLYVYTIRLMQINVVILICYIAESFKL